MSQDAQHIRRATDLGQRPHASRKPSAESSRSSASHAPRSDEYVQLDIPDAGPRSSGGRSERKGNGAPPSISRDHQVGAPQEGRSGLPAEKGFPIQIGSELFRLSGTSIMSDSPSYFSNFFEEQLRQSEDSAGGIRTLYIDRDPSTFRDICRHLQGYHVQPRDGGHYVRLFADAQFYSLPRLISQLFESEIFIQIGDENFQIPRDIFSSPGNNPNFFTLGFAAFFASPNEVFPGLDRLGLMRPPAILPPSVHNRSAHIFTEILHLLRGYPLHIRNEEHRAELIRDCRYFHLKGLEQRVILHHISYNIERQRSEIILRLEDIRQSGVSFVADASPSDRSPLAGWVNYARPFVDETSSELILEISGENTKIELGTMRAEFHGDAKARITSLFQVIANKMNLPTTMPLGLMMASGGIAAQAASPGNTPLSEDKVKVRIERDAHILLDGDEYQLDDDRFETYGDDGASRDRPVVSPPLSATVSSTASLPMMDTSHPKHINRPSSTQPPPRKRKRRGSLDDFGEWIIRKGQWRLHVQSRGDFAGTGQAMEIVLYAVKLDAVSGQRGRNMLRGFLS